MTEGVAAALGASTAVGVGMSERERHQVAPTTRIAISRSASHGRIRLLVCAWRRDNMRCRPGNGCGSVADAVVHGLLDVGVVDHRAGWQGAVDADEGIPEIGGRLV